MKHRHIINLLWVVLPVCILLRLIQLLFTIDTATGFIKQQYSDISTLISFVIFAAIAALCVMAYFAEGVAKNCDGPKPILAITSVLTGGMYVYETVVNLSSLGSLQSVLLMFLSLMSAITFLAFGLNHIYPFNFPNFLLITPAIYYIVKLIELFISTSALALVTENVFLLFTCSALLWFWFEFANYENNLGDPQKSHKKIFACGITAAMFCIVTSVPKLFLLNSQNEQITRGDISAAVVMLSQAIFILSYLISSFYKKESSDTQHISKHSA